MEVVGFLVVLRQDAISICSDPAALRRSRNSRGGSWNVVFTGPFTVPAWKPALPSPKDIAEAMIITASKDALVLASTMKRQLRLSQGSQSGIPPAGG